jgi:hypothetical protein
MSRWSCVLHIIALLGIVSIIAIILESDLIKIFWSKYLPIMNIHNTEVL